MIFYYKHHIMKSHKFLHKDCIIRLQYSLIEVWIQGFIQALCITEHQPLPKSKWHWKFTIFGYKFPNWLIYIFLIMSVPINKCNKVNNSRKNLQLMCARSTCFKIWKLNVARIPNVSFHQLNASLISIICNSWYGSWFKEWLSSVTNRKVPSENKGILFI